MPAQTIKRCPWAQGREYEDYHDQEWGVPLHDDQRLFEMLILEGAQAGLSWITILKKREAYRRAFDYFDARRVASYDERKVSQLLDNANIVRNRLKIRSAINNAKLFLDIQAEYGSFDRYIWQFTDYQAINNKFRNMAAVPATSKESDRMSQDLRQRGFKFVGSTICYALMQSIGMVNDHLVTCFRYQEIANDTISLDSG